MLLYSLGKIRTAGLVIFCMAWMAAHSQAADEWTQVNTKNFLLIGDATETEIRLTAARLEQFRETIRAIFPQIRLDGGVRTNVVVFKSPASYSPYKPRRPDGSVDEAVAGYFQSGEDVNYITLAVSDRPDAYRTIFHEYVHFLLDTNIGRSDLPPWFNEGLAEYFETLIIGSNGQVTIGIPPPGHLAMLRKDGLIPLKAFFEIDNSALHQRGDRSRNLYYAQAWLLTHYLLHTGNVRGGERLGQLLRLMKTRHGGSEGLLDLLQTDETALEATLKKYIGQPQLPVRPVQLSLRLDLANEMTAVQLPDARSSAVLGDLLYHTGRLAEAETMLRRALAIDNDEPIANISLGLVYAQKKNFAGARRLLEKAISADQSNHFAFFNYAYAISRESSDEYGNVESFAPEDAAKMQKALMRSIELKPDFAESYRLLALISMVKNEDLDRSLELLKKALSFRPGDEELRLLLAEVYLRQEKYIDARQIAENLVEAASDASIWAKARSVLHTVSRYFAAKDAGAVRDEESKVFGPIPPLILKRSSMTESDVAQIDEERMVFNLNLMVAAPRFAERQFVGYIDKIGCVSGDIIFNVRTGHERFNLTSDNFTGLRMGVLTEGERSFTIDCGVRLDKQMAVMTYLPSVNSKPNIRGRLLAIWFVPDYFRLKTPEEMAARRTVIIEDDRVFFKSSSGKSSQTVVPQ